MPDTDVMLTGEQIQERIAVLFSTDAAVCEGCGAVAGPVADDPSWLIDTAMEPNPSCPDEPVSVAIIRCPEC